MNTLKHLLLFTTACSSHPAIMAQETAPQRPNVVIILGDDIGYGDLSCNGEKRFILPM